MNETFDIKIHGICDYRGVTETINSAFSLNVTREINLVFPRVGWVWEARVWAVILRDTKGATLCL